MTRCALYRHFDANDTLLYVGISVNHVSRLAQHGASHWFYDIARISIEWHPSTDDALAAEYEAITSEKPLHNTTHNKPGAVRRFVREVGREVLAERLGVGLSAVSNAEQRDTFPCSWAHVVADLCATRGLFVPISAFSFIGAETNRDCVTVLFPKRSIDDVPPASADLLAEIEAFLAETGMGPSAFGRAAVNDGSLVKQLQEGRELLGKTRAKVLTFISTHRAAS